MHHALLPLWFQSANSAFPCKILDFSTGFWLARWWRAMGIVEKKNLIFSLFPSMLHTFSQVSSPIECIRWGGSRDFACFSSLIHFFFLCSFSLFWVVGKSFEAFNVHGAQGNNEKKPSFCFRTQWLPLIWLSFVLQVWMWVPWTERLGVLIRCHLHCHLSKALLQPHFFFRSDKAYDFPSSSSLLPFFFLLQLKLH